MVSSLHLQNPQYDKISLTLLPSSCNDPIKWISCFPRAAVTGSPDRVAQNS